MSQLSQQRLVAYTGLRKDVVTMIRNQPTRVLDVGCSNGALLEYLKKERGVRLAVGIEVDEHLAAEAAGKCDCIVVSDLDTFESSTLKYDSFDLIVLADVLEHTVCPRSVLKEVLKVASEGAQVIISLPNIQHWTAIKNLLVGKWPQRERGLFDSTHLRFFTYRSLIELADACELRIEAVHRKCRIRDAPGGALNRFARFLNIWPIRSYFTYQYVVSMRRVTLIS